MVGIESYKDYSHIDWEEVKKEVLGHTSTVTTQKVFNLEER